MNRPIRFPYWLIIILLAAFAVGYWAWSESLRDDQSMTANSLNPLFSKEGAKGELERGEGGEFQDWKTYRNEEYGFEMKYPPTFTFKADALPIISIYHVAEKYEFNHFSSAEEKYEKAIGYFSSHLPNNDIADCSFVLSSYEKPFTLSLLGEPSFPDLLRIGGVQAYELDNYGPNGAGYVVYIPTANRTLIVDFFDCGESKENNPITYKDQILSTFRFIE